VNAGTSEPGKPGDSSSGGGGGGRAPGREAWERRPGESARAYEAFARYRDLPIAERSYRRVAQELGKSGALIARWCSAHNWTDRAAAWDAEQERQWLAAQQQARRDAAERHIRAGQLAQTKATKALLDLNPEDLSPGELVRVLEAGVRIERDAYADVLARGGRGPLTVTGPGGGAVELEVRDFTALPPDQRARRLAELTAAAEARAKALSGDDDE
jgi:hypothetical protein